MYHQSELLSPIEFKLNIKQFAQFLDTQGMFSSNYYTALFFLS